MKNLPAGSRALLIACLFVVSAPAWGAGAGADGRYRFCTITLKSDEEKNLFMQHLNPSKFEFTELTHPPGWVPGTPIPTDWFHRQCQSGLQCDVLLISGHFADGFKGANLDGRLRLEMSDLESAACEYADRAPGDEHAGCAGILQKPLIRMTYACNTLASKDGDFRSPEKYFETLIQDHSSLDGAQYVVEARYGKYGAPYRERMEFIFGGDPTSPGLIDGFRSISPDGEQNTILLKKYFDGNGDFSAFLQNLESERAVRSIDQLNDPQFYKAYPAIWNGIECLAMGPGDPRYERRKQMCVLKNEHQPVKDRLQQIDAIAANGTFDEFLPQIEAFLKKHPPTRYGEDERATLRKIASEPQGKESLTDLIKTTHGPWFALKRIELGKQIGFYADDEADELRRYTLIKSLHLLAHSMPADEPENPNDFRHYQLDARTKTDLLCRGPWQGPKGDEPMLELEPADVDPSLYNDTADVLALFCTQPETSPIEAQLEGALFTRSSLVSEQAIIARFLVSSATPKARARVEKVLSALPPADPAHAGPSIHDRLDEVRAQLLTPK